MAQSLYNWVHEGFHRYSGPNQDLIQKSERKLRCSAPTWAHVSARLQTDPEYFLDVLDFLLSLPPQFAEIWPQKRANELAQILQEGGSVWKVVEAKQAHALERRVDSTVSANAELLLASEKPAGRHLRKAWQLAYSRSQNPGECYREVVKAVEAAAIPVVCPDDLTATLGKINGEIRANTSRFKMDLQGEGGERLDAVLGPMEAIWKGQVDRHGNSIDVKNIRSEEAETALHLAVSVVHAFQSGAFGRRKNKP